MMTNGDIVAIIANKRCLNSDISSHTAYVGDWRGFGRGNSNRVAGLQNLKKQTSTLLGGYTVEVVKSPASGGATLTFQTELLVERVEMAP
jgi:hypothetical protein